MSKETAKEHAFALHHYKNDENVKFAAENGTVKGNKFTLSKAATEAFFDKEGYTKDMRETAAKAERALSTTLAHVATELMDVRLKEAQKEGLKGEDLEKIRTEAVVTDPNYKIEARLQAVKHGRNPANGETTTTHGALTFTHKLKKTVGQDVFESTSKTVKAMLKA
jgi:hypothetical protein